MLMFVVICKQWRSKWEHAPRGASIGGASVPFINPFKNAFSAEIYTKICLKILLSSK